MEMQHLANTVGKVSVLSLQITRAGPPCLVCIFSDCPISSSSMSCREDDTVVISKASSHRAPAIRTGYLAHSGAPLDAISSQ